MDSAAPARFAKDFLSILDLSPVDLDRLLRISAQMKADRRLGRQAPSATALAGLHVALLFEKPSLRTRSTFEIAIRELGGDTLHLPATLAEGTREPLQDVARNLERFVDGIVARTGPHEVVTELAAQSSVPVINGLTLREHPCQALADVFTIRERFGDVRGRVLAFVGDGNNVYHSLALLGATMGMEIRLAHPDGYEPNDRIVAQAKGLAAASGGKLVFATEPEDVVRGAAVIYTDAWTSMGQEAEAEERRDAFERYQVNQAMLDRAGDAVVMHCLPAHRGEEITSDVMDGPRSIIFDQSENRLHSQKALLAGLLAG